MSEANKSIIGKSPFAAAVYIPKQGDKTALPKFVAALQGTGVTVAGILQESRIKPGHNRRTIEAVDITTGHRTEIKRPMKSDIECGLDASNLVETTAILRAAIQTRPDLVVVEKFGDQEQIGEGLFDEIFQIIAENIPLLIAVPQPALPIWQERTAEMGKVIAFTLDEMNSWWNSLSDTA